MYFPILKLLMFLYLNSAHLIYYLRNEQIEHFLFIAICGWMVLRIVPDRKYSPNFNAGIMIAGIGTFALAMVLMGSLAGYLYWPSYIYELVKLCLPFAFLIPLKFNDDNQRELIRSFRSVMQWILILNTVTILLQLLMGWNYPTMRELYNAEFLDMQFRPQGLFFSCNNMAMVLIFYYLFDYILADRQFEPGMPAWQRALVWCGILISQSKMSILAFMLIIFYRKKMLRLRWILPTLCIIISIQYVFYNYNIMRSQEKIDSYIKLWDLEEVDINELEGRAQALRNAIFLVRNNFPLGTGLGTWGDGSARLNPYVRTGSLSIFYNRLSDSTLAHYLVEQGILIILYLFLWYRATCFTPIGRIVFLTLLMMLSSMQSFSQGNVPLVFLMTLFALNSDVVNRAKIPDTETEETGECGQT